MSKLNKTVLKKTILATLTYSVFMTAWHYSVNDEKELKTILFSLLSYMTFGVVLYFIYRWEYRKEMKKELEDEKNN